MKKIKKAFICGKPHTIEYEKNIKLVDGYGVLYPHTNKIVIFDNDISEDRTEFILHEAVEVVTMELKINIEHDDLERLVVGLADFLTRNKLLKD